MIRTASSNTARAIAVFLATAALGGCATSRGVLDVRTALGAAPSGGPAVTIDSIVDKRTFEVAPREPSTPSLKNGEVSNPAITSRAIARKRNGYGQALGDILLPEGRSVEHLVREALTQALHSAGYRVAGADVTSTDATLPVDVDVVEFWAWFSPGFWAAHLECRIRLRVRGAAPPFAGEQEFQGYVRLATQAATGKAWQNTINGAIASLIADIRARLAKTPTRGVADGSTSAPSAP